ncbi:exodeoxyribonuclease V subunit beta [uncultured Paraglaciecola sp.]|uniref:exodeoxyribonuclease V subunit beta n=1 Tax=uncultured Paraglaciecola sp. TaxID=1765024 RepID=UPI00261B360E|nr:exodeoxyribonuclease V subunit beta [uncultured Paraglaciecola sp.]
MSLTQNETATNPHSAMQPLDTFTFPLSGASLIEASAGTGKTYTIVNLYIRLLLGHGCAPLNVEQILVVTFTNAATGELKERIRQRLRQAYLDFFAGTSQDQFIQQLIAQSDDIQRDCQRLALASKQMDEAAVYTIHGFCHKALTEHAFESGAMYEQNFILDESQWLKLASEDYWRKHVVTLPLHSLQMLLDQWAAPEVLLKDIKRFLNQHATSKQTITIEDAIKSVDSYVAYLNKVKKWWVSNEVSQQLSKANLKGNAKLAKLPTLQAMQALCKSDGLQIDFDAKGWLLFSPEQIVKAAKKGSEDLSHLDFSQFEQLHQLFTQCQNNVILAVSAHGLKEISANLASQKQMLQLLSPDDLLVALQQALSHQAAGTNADGASSLAKIIKQNYPAALIDEFQDTDPIQFEVFKGIYSKTKHSHESDPAACWIMIGDPKQAIYAFRGADIFTYIKAKDWVACQRHFTLATNWRSAPSLIHVINQLFASSKKGFMFENSIPFYPVKAGRELAGLSIKGETIKSLDFNHLTSAQGQPISANVASLELAKATANQISQWLQLAQNQQAQIQGRALTAADFCVLVRDRKEAQLIKDALAKVNVASVYLARKSVFTTTVAIDLLRVLKALSHPTDERLLKAALMSELFTFTAQQLDTLFTDESRWQDVLEQRFYWHQTWQKYGVIKAINQVLDYFDVEQQLIKHLADGLRRITDLRHLSELLQQQSLQLVGETQLIHWFENCIVEPDHQNESQQIRLESDANLVQIITLHSSKGLEFPLVFIPFASSYRSAQQALYHNDSQQLEVDFLDTDHNLQKADFERLAEDIRLLYVAVTRAIYYCSIGVWNITLGKSKKSSGFTLSGLGSLLMETQDSPELSLQNSISDQQIAERIQALAEKCELSYRSFTEALPAIKLSPPEVDPQQQTLLAKQLKSPINREWRLTSYSAISSQQAHLDMPAPGQDEGLDHLTNIEFEAQLPEQAITGTVQQSPFSFERGANAGSFLHGVLENTDLQQPQQLPDAITQQSTWFGISDDWHDCVKSWLSDVLLSPFAAESENAKLCLNELSAKHVKVEMEFHMPLHHVKVKDFNHIINQYFKQHKRDYQFEQLNGMIKGFIDLMFEFDGKFYVADYKSNHLGNGYEHYRFASMQQAMSDHDYHLQAILYTLALHRWLSLKLPNYDYDTHIGGAYYLFLRGMTQAQPGNGVYFMLPEKSMIEALDRLFSGEQLATSPQQSQQKSQMDLW